MAKKPAAKAPAKKSTGKMPMKGPMPMHKGEMPMKPATTMAKGHPNPFAPKGKGMVAPPARKAK